MFEFTKGKIGIYVSQNGVPISGLGHTVTELDVSQVPVFPKTQFSMLIPEVENHLKKLTGN